MIGEPNQFPLLDQINFDFKFTTFTPPKPNAKGRPST